MIQAGGWLLGLPRVVLAVVVDECAHGVVAPWRGDATAHERGRLTLNPVARLHHWFGSVVFLLALLALGRRVLCGRAKPVPVNRANLRDPRNDAVKVAVAGPASNLLLGLGFAGLLAAMPEAGARRAAQRMCGCGVLINCALAVADGFRRLCGLPRGLLLGRLA